MRYIIMLLGCVIGLIACSQQSPLRDSNGHILTNEINGKWLVVNYWATWCTNCHTEVAQLNMFYNKHHKAIEVLGVDYDHLPMKALDQAVRHFGIQYPVLSDNPQSRWNLPVVGVVPTTFIVNPQGKMVKKLEGQQSASSLSHTMHYLMTQQQYSSKRHLLHIKKIVLRYV